jgi:hypothetical protein
VFGPLLLLTGWLSWKYHEPAEKRSLRMAVSIYVFAGVAMTAMSLIQHFTPDPAAAAARPEHSRAAAPGGRRQAAPSAAAPVASALPGGKPKKTGKNARGNEGRAREAAQGARRPEGRGSQGLHHRHYLDAVDVARAPFLEKAAGDAGFAVVLTSMFLLGVWFVRSGVMEDTAAHLAFFRKLALYGLPVGIGLGLLTSFIAMSHTPGDRYDGWGIARGLTMLGNLPACLGYVGWW